MSLLNNTLLLGETAGGGGGGGYQISRSLRFNSADSAYLSRTPASAGNRKTWTWAAWVKRSRLGTNQSFLAAYSSGTVYSYFRFTTADVLDIYSRDGGGTQLTLTTSQVFRDPSSWMHIALLADTTQGSAADRFKIYINGTQVTAFSASTYPAQNTDLAFGGTYLHSIGDLAQSTQYFDGYLADVHFIDGQALTPSSFGQFDATTGVWNPNAYTGTYGTNGFHINFADNSNNTATTLGKDTSGNGNNWTPTNLSVTAGAGNDSLVDSPTNYGTDTGAGGEVRGNYATLNPLWFYSSSNTGTLSNGNLEYAGPGSAWGSRYSTIGVTSGKWYFEASPTTSGPTFMVGIVTAASTDHVGTTGFAYYQNGNKYNYGSVSAYGATYTTGDIIGVAFDLDAGSITFYKNGTSQGTAFTGIASGTYYPGISCFATTGAFNAGQRPFAYAAPSGFKALCSTNLPTPTILKGSDYFDTVLWNGTGGNRSLTGLSFSPDFTWIKQRNAAFSVGHQIYDIVRGAGSLKQLDSSNTTAEGGGNTDQYGYLSSFDSAGFSVTAGSIDSDYVNRSGFTYAAWCWDAGSSTVTNTAGTITSQVRANASAGFSIVTYTGSGANSTIGHGLGVAPQLIITKNRSSSSFNWGVYHASAGNTGYLKLNLTDAFATQATWQNTSPTSTVFYVGNYNSANQVGDNYVAYCFAPVSGYSAFGSYTGNGSADGPFVYCGFRPRWLMIKSSTTAGTNWLIVDAARDTYNAVFTDIQANTSNPENQNQPTMDFTGNGFKLRNISSNANGSSATFIYAAFAENPFSIARAR